MSTGKRLAKRSIMGTRIAALGDDGKYYPGIITSVSSYGTYFIKFDGSVALKECKETDMIGPGFQNVTSSKLRAGQNAYITHCNREMRGTVLHHRPNIDQVVIRLSNGGEEVKKKLEDIRLLESRKSTRLVNQNPTDFSKLADFNIVHERQRLNSETSDVSHTSSRKRRSSESESSGDEGGSPFYSSGSESDRHTPVMSECTAAMVLMNLSFSPRSKQQLGCVSQAPGTAMMSTDNGGISPSSTSSGVSSLGSSWTSLSAQQSNFPEAEALLQLSNQESDEGIVSDQSSAGDSDEPAKRIKTEHVRIIYQCTWPGCSVQKDICSDIERHIRKEHLGKADPESEEENDHEEEFYFNEIDVPMESSETSSYPSSAPPPSVATPVAPPTIYRTPIQETLAQQPIHHLLVQSSQNSGIQILTTRSRGPSSVPVLADHMDMARPPHENPEYRSVLIASPSSSAPHPQLALPIAIPANFSFSSSSLPTSSAVSMSSFAPTRIQSTFSQPVSSSSSSSSSSCCPHQSKYIRLSPKPLSSASPKSPVRRPRGDAKKCRKIYGMERRELWCTQCKWKKACTRFGESN